MDDNQGTKQWPQYLATITATLSVAIAGCHIGWTSPSLPYLKSDESHISMTSDDASWIASFFLLGSMLGNLAAAAIVDRFGRKVSLLVSGIPLTIGWILIIIAWNPYVLYISRFVSGLGQGIVYVVCPMYIGEIADKKIRGALGSFIKLMVTFGELYAHAIGPFVNYHNLAYSCVIIPVLFFASFIWTPESPYYLIMKGDQEGAIKSLSSLRRYKSKDRLQNDLDEMTKTVYTDMKNRGHFWDLFRSEGNRKAMIIIFGLQVVLQFSGLAAIESYTQEIIAGSESGLNPGVAVIILSLFQFVAGLGAAALVDKAGRRSLLLSTTSLCGIALSISCIFYLMKLQFKYYMSDVGWILDASIISYELICALGLNPLPYMMMGELFPTNVKGVAVSLSNIWASFLAFFVAKMYQVVTDTCGIYASLAWFASSCFFGIGFIYFFVPETNGKSLAEIQEELNRGKKKNNIDKVFHEIYVKTIEC
ncbi:facilitated trehalose transporter Tret1-like [Chelonus insularis]|uniref:facilitated trehalose transporter Tret1-like n=1 Tax=Chelonus insularis TaxID=460826 RepID=UPI00158C182B|nr:facilitated trehalose transporter Tret1-like [Chelonus insularis]